VRHPSAITKLERKELDGDPTAFLDQAEGDDGLARRAFHQVDGIHSRLERLLSSNVSHPDNVGGWLELRAPFCTQAMSPTASAIRPSSL
jgi:hypothetical protein